MRRARPLPLAVRSALKKVKQVLSGVYGDRLKGIYLYGSYSRGDFSEASDVDLLIALDGEVNPWKESSRMSEALGDISLRHDVLVATYAVPYRWLQERRSPLFENIRREGVLV